MVSPSQRRRAVELLQQRLGVSQRRACQIVHQHRVRSSKHKRCAIIETSIGPVAD